MKESKTKLVVNGRPFERIEFEVQEIMTVGKAPAYTIIGSCSARAKLHDSIQPLGWVRATKVLNGLLEETMENIAKARKAKKSVRKVAPATYEFEAEEKIGSKTYLKRYEIRPVLDQLIA